MNTSIKVLLLHHENCSLLPSLTVSSLSLCLALFFVYPGHRTQYLTHNTYTTKNALVHQWIVFIHTKLHFCILLGAYKNVHYSPKKQNGFSYGNSRPSGKPWCKDNKWCFGVLGIPSGSHWQLARDWAETWRNCQAGWVLQQHLRMA